MVYAWHYGVPARERTDMKNHRNVDNGGAASRWDDDGGAPKPDVGRRPGDARAADRRLSQQGRLDVSHQSDTRGEHRYGDAHQTEAEQRARKNRDDLKWRLAGHNTRRVS
jgi:hypothetical protein